MYTNVFKKKKSHIPCIEISIQFMNRCIQNLESKIKKQYKSCQDVSLALLFVCRFTYPYIHTKYNLMQSKTKYSYI